MNSLILEANLFEQVLAKTPLKDTRVTRRRAPLARLNLESALFWQLLKVFSVPYSDHKRFL